MDIFSIVDCEDCESYKFHQGRTEGDPDQCYSDEVECTQDEPCERMLGAIHDMISDGYLGTENGQFRTRDCLQDEQKDEDLPECFRTFDFSLFPYFWLPNNYDVDHVKAYKDEEAVFWDLFI